MADSDDDRAALRARAEALVAAPAAGTPADPPEVSARLLHELRVHQVELEMQNDELRRAGLALEASRARYLDLYDHAPVGFFTVAADGLIRDANATLARMLGVALGSLEGQALTRFVLPEDQDTLYLHRQKLPLTDTPEPCELRLQRAGGPPFWASLHMVRATNPASGTEGTWRTAVSDVTARHTAEAAMRVSEERHRVLFEGSSEALFTLAPPDWRFATANDAAIAFFGEANAEALRANTPWHYAPPHQPDGRASLVCGAEAIATALREGSCALNWRHRLTGGQEIAARVLLTRIGVAGELRLLGTWRDETARQRLTAHLAQLDRLASMGLLASSVGHELNNPLAYVSLNLELLADKLPELDGADPSALARARELIEQCLDGLRRMKVVSSEIAAVARVQHEAHARFDLNEAVGQALRMTSDEAGARARVATELGVVPPLFGASARVVQLFVNLLVNAAHAIPEGAVARNLISVRTWTEGGEARAEIRDTGGGIAPENLERIFEPFFTTKNPLHGSGLGLTIAAAIAKEIGGTISVESELGIGSRFLVRLPLPAVASLPVVKVTPGAPATVSGARVLVIDDESAMRRSLTRVLVGLDVVTAASGAEAKARLERDTAFDVILCDMMMPGGMSGIDLHTWLAGVDDDLARRFVIMTGGASTPKAAAYLEATKVTRLDKPSSAVALRAAITEVLRAVGPRRRG